MHIYIHIRIHRSTQIYIHTYTTHTPSCEVMFLRRTVSSQPQRDQLQHTTTHHTTPHHITPHLTIPHHTIPHHTTLYHTTPHHTTPHHTIPHHTTLQHNKPYLGQTSLPHIYPPPCDPSRLRWST
jgi:hypothetical protein